MGLVIDQSLKAAADATKPTSAFVKGGGYVPFISAVPLLSLYNHLVIYLFLPIARKDVALALGSTASLVCMSLFLGIELSQVRDLWGASC